MPRTHALSLNARRALALFGALAAILAALASMPARPAHAAGHTAAMTVPSGSSLQVEVYCKDDAHCVVTATNGVSWGIYRVHYPWDVGDAPFPVGSFSAGLKSPFLTARGTLTWWTNVNSGAVGYAYFFEG